MSTYLGLIHPPEGGSEWGVTFPDVPGCVSAGVSFEAAVEAGREALSGHIAMLIAEGLPRPSARTLTELRADPAVATDLEDAIVQLIATHRITGKRVRIDIMIDTGVLRATDEAADARGMSRSAFIEAALAGVAQI